MTCVSAAKTTPNMIGLTVKNIIIKKQLKKNSKFLVIYFVLFSRAISMRIGWFTDVPPTATLHNMEC